MPLLDQLQAAVDDLCCAESVIIETAARTLVGIAEQHPDIVRFYARTLVCVAGVRARHRDGPALLELLAVLGLVQSTTDNRAA